MTGPRVDRDCRVQPTSRDIDRLLQSIREFAPHALIVADHGKGFVTQALMTAFCRLQVPIYVDPVPSTPMIDGTICIGGEHEQPRAAHLPRGEVIKLGPRGLRWSIDGQPGTAPSRCRQLVDPLGAGDQFIAALAFQRCFGSDWSEAIEWANLAAGLQCERAGCVPLSLDEIEAAHDSSVVTA
jgi:bifunctional ADP-heptose synthase (sugar kinase/adenylyltransferase)